jgi:hypothetical protein
MKIFKTLVIGTTLLLLLLIFTNTVPAEETSTGNWPRFRYNEDHLGCQPLAGNADISNYGIKWYKDFGDEAHINDLIYGEISVADINYDGKKDILFGTENGRVYCLDLNGNIKWQFETSGSVSSTPTLININNDNNLEVIFSERSGSPMNRAGKIFALSADGKLIWDYSNEESSDGFDASAAVGDITGDGELDIVVGSLDGNVYTLTKNGTLIWKYDTGNWVESSAVLLDIDDDNKKEVIVGNGNAVMYAITTVKEIEYPNIPRLRKEVYKPKVIWQFETKQVNNIGFVGSPVVVDLENDNESEIIFGASEGNLYCLNDNGIELWRYHAGSPIYTTPAVADINKDGRIEIVFGSDDSLITIDSSGRYLWQKDFSMGIGSNPSIFDVNGDGFLEITSIDQEWLTLGPGIEAERWINSTNILNYKGEIIHKLQFFDNIYDWVYGVSIADLENDGELEILVGTSESYVYCYGKIDPSIQNNNEEKITDEDNNKEDNKDKNNDSLPSFDLIFILISLIVTSFFLKHSKKNTF